MAENGSVSGQYEGDNYASPSPSTGSGNSIRHMGGNSKELFDLFFHSSKITGDGHNFFKCIFMFICS